MRVPATARSEHRNGTPVVSAAQHLAGGDSTRRLHLGSLRSSSVRLAGAAPQLKTVGRVAVCVRNVGTGLVVGAKSGHASRRLRALGFRRSGCRERASGKRSSVTLAAGHGGRHAAVKRTLGRPAVGRAWLEVGVLVADLPSQRSGIGEAERAHSRGRGRASGYRQRCARGQQQVTGLSGVGWSRHRSERRNYAEARATGFANGLGEVGPRKGVGRARSGAAVIASQSRHAEQAARQFERFPIVFFYAAQRVASLGPRSRVRRSPSRTTQAGPARPLHSWRRASERLSQKRGLHARTGAPAEHRSGTP